MKKKSSEKNIQELKVNVIFCTSHGELSAYPLLSICNIILENDYTYILTHTLFDISLDTTVFGKKLCLQEDRKITDY